VSNTLADIRISANLIDDSLYLEKPPVYAGDLTGRLAVVQNTGGSETASELVTVGSDGDSLVHFRPDAASNSGWASSGCTPRAGAAIARLEGFYQGQLLNVLAHYASGDGIYGIDWVQRDAATGAWSQAAAGNLASSAASVLDGTFQCATYVDGASRPWVYGVTGEYGGAFFLIGWNAAAAQWQLVSVALLQSFDPPLAPGGVVFKLGPSDAGHDLRVVWASGGIVYWLDADIQTSGSTETLVWAAAAPQSFQPYIGTVSGARWIDLPASLAADNLLLLDNDQTLYLFAGFTGADATEAVLTGGSGQPAGAVEVVAGSDGSGSLLVYAIAAGDSPQLWYLPQSGASPTGGAPLAFGSWVTLGDTLASIAGSSTCAYGPELFMVDDDSNLLHLARTCDASDPADTTQQVWITRRVAQPTAQTADTAPANCACCNMEVSTVDANGNPVSGVVLTLTVDHAVTVIVGNIAHALDQGSQLAVPTDPSGQATVKFQAQDLKPPLCTFAAGEVTRWCQGDQVQVKDGETGLPPLTTSMANRLQGNDSSRPVTNTALQQPIATPDNPQVSIQPLMASSYQPSQSGDAASAIQAMGQWLDASNTDQAGNLCIRNLDTRHWTLDFKAEGGPSFRALSDDEARALLAAVRRRPAADALGGIGAVFGDVAHFFKHVWNELDEFSAVVDEVTGDLTVVFNAATSFVIATVKQAGEALETVFNRIVEGLKSVLEAIEDVLAWLKMLFDWGDILNTHQVLKQCVNTTLDNIAGSDFSALEDKVQSFASWLTEQVDTAFDALESTFGSQSFNTFANTAASASASASASATALGAGLRAGLGAGSGAGGNVLAATPCTNAHQNNASQANYAWSTSKTNASAIASQIGAALSGQPSSGGCDPATILEALGSELVDDLTSAGEQMVDYVTATLADDPSAFFTLGIADFLLEGAKLAIDTAISGFTDVLLALIELAACGVVKLKNLLNTPIDIPVLSWLYKNVITGTPTHPGDDLCLLDLLCLIFAIPATIIYKVLNDAAPFTGSDAQSIADDGLLWPTRLPALEGSASPVLPARDGAGSGSVSPTLLKTLGEIGGVMQIVATLVLICADGLAASTDDDAVAAGGEGGPSGAGAGLGDDEEAFGTLVSWAQIIVGAIALGVSAPGAITPNNAGESLDDAEIATLTGWCVSGVQLIADIWFTLTEGGDMEFQAAKGPVADSLIGFVLLGLGVFAAVEQAKSSNYDGWDVADSLVGPLVSCPRFMVNLGDDALPVLYVLDFVFGCGGAVTDIGSAADG
jgi:hypothetical protein